MATNKQYAIRYAELGLSIVPLQYRNKVPPMGNWQNLATKDPATIAAWWSPGRIPFQSFNSAGNPVTWYSNPGYNIGFLTGAKSSRIVVLDLDEHPEDGRYGIEIAEDWEREHGKFPETWCAVTGSGGRHLYFRDTCDRPRLQHLYDRSVDFQSGDALIVLPPSIHPTGNPYYWDLSPGDVPLADIDDNVLAFIAEGQKSQAGTATNANQAALAETIMEGNRVNSMFRLTAKLQSAGLSEDNIIEIIQRENLARCKPPLTDTELEREVFPAIRRYSEETSSAYYRAFELPERLSGQSRFDSLYRAVYWLKSKGFSDLAIRSAISAENTEKCDPPLEESILESRVLALALSNFRKGGKPDVRQTQRLRLDSLSPLE